MPKHEFLLEEYAKKIKPLLTLHISFLSTIVRLNHKKLDLTYHLVNADTVLVSRIQTFSRLTVICIYIMYNSIIPPPVLKDNYSTLQ